MAQKKVCTCTRILLHSCTHLCDVCVQIHENYKTEDFVSFSFSSYNCTWTDGEFFFYLFFFYALLRQYGYATCPRLRESRTWTRQVWVNYTGEGEGLLISQSGRAGRSPGGHWKQWIWSTWLHIKTSSFMESGPVSRVLLLHVRSVDTATLTSWPWMKCLKIQCFTLSSACQKAPCHKLAN